jgi:hypothetical protein
MPFAPKISLPRPVLMSFASTGAPTYRSFPKAGIHSEVNFANASSTVWIPAFAGMTCAGNGIPIPMTPPPTPAFR